MNDLSQIADETLLDMCERAIWASVSQPHDSTPEYDRAMEFMAESQRRLVAAGHDERCRRGVYEQAYENATAQLSWRTPETLTCTCQTVAARAAIRSRG